MGQPFNILQALRKSDDGRLGIRSLAARCLVAIALAGAAQVVRIPFHSPTTRPFITYAPFVVMGALLGGFGPGLLTTVLCTLETIYFSVEPVGSFAVQDPTQWDGIGALLLTGVVASILVERLKRSDARLVDAHGKTGAILEGISDGFNTFDREWRYTYVNAAAARMLGKAPEELLGRTLWELWPQAEESPFGAAYRRAVAANVPMQVESYYPEPLNAWFEVRCYPSRDGLSLFFTNTTERRRAEERLRLMESAILQTRDAVLILKVAGGDSCRPEPVFVNSAFEQMTGFSLEDLQAGSLTLLYGSRLDPHSIERPRAGCPVGCPDNMEQRVSRKDGSEFWAEFDFRPLADARGDYTHCVWTCRDITERKQAAESARLLSSIVECSDDAIVSKNLDGIVLTWNQGAERIYGYSSAEMVGRSMSLLVPPDRPDEFPEIMQYLRLGQRIEHLETERMKKNGQRIFVSLTISPLRDASGIVVGASAIARDITGRKQAEKALELSEERYRSLALATAQVVWSTNPQGAVVEDIASWRDFTGQSPDELRGWGWINAIHPDDRERAVEICSKAVKNRNSYTTEYRVRRHDGEYRWMSVGGVPVLEKEQTIREWVGTWADITDRVRAEEEVRKLNETLEKRVVERTAELAAANQELEAFAYSVSHDLRAPLRAVDGFSRILLEEHGPALPAEAQHYLGVVRKNAVQMGNLIDDLLAFSRLNRQPLSKRPVDLAGIARQVIEDLDPERQGRRIEIQLEDLPHCEADPALLRQVLANLLSNAVKYTRCRDRARIEIGASGPPRGGAVYFVRDNGAGFDMRYADKLFGVFQRLHSAEEYEGTGVGLAIVHRIVTRHGGRVWAEAAPDKGATFYFTLPVEGRLTQPDAGTQDRLVHQ
ncbi:MAG: PAS domain S-box protein [Acidobacteriia bacterium]|nr:PAS domain S-box protein [Terriglobia bacterium]